MLNTAVALILFNRADTAEKVVSEIAKARPKKLYVFADGPRADKADDIERCGAARAVIDRIDWDCQVFKNYSEKNLGCGDGPATGISWVFEKEESAIILEDDCVPHPSFFWYCEELLEKYKNDSRIMHISGTHRTKASLIESVSYTFSKFTISFGGFATWRRAWNNYDFEMKLWPELRNTPWLTYYLVNEKGAEAYRNIFDFAYGNLYKRDFWDYQWIFTVMVNNALSILPNVNLHTNIGCREDGTHMKSNTHKYANLPIQAMRFPLTHPKCIISNYDRDSSIIEDVVANQRKKEDNILLYFRKHASRIVPQKYKAEIKRVLSLIRGLKRRQIAT